MTNKSRNLPTGRLSRFTKIGALATRVASNMLTEGAKELAAGNRPKIKDLLLTPANAKRIADQLAQLRGAAMKVGQLISMDAGDILPDELSELLARLRSNAEPMPRKQLHALLENEWGTQWRKRFIRFDVEPMAAASIGQVHRATAMDFTQMAVKVQYPGIKASINSDVDNVAALIKLTGLLPSGMNIKPLLEEAKQQLHDEADYLLEAERLETFGRLIENDPAFAIPQVIHPYCTSNLLAMSYVEGVAIEDLATTDYTQETRNWAVSQLFRLFFAELFAFKLVQTDPNFANFQFNRETQQIVLLDFGATREYSQSMSDAYKHLMQAAIASDHKAVHAAALDIGLLIPELPEAVQSAISAMCMQACEALFEDKAYDFANSDLLERLRDQGIALGLEKTYAHTPHPNAIFLHRKLGGLFLLAIKLKAQVNVRELFTPYLT